MRKQEIRNEFNKKVAALMAEGYEIFPDSMSGCQGEIAKIDLVKDGKLVRVYLEKDFKVIQYEGTHEYADVIVLVVGYAPEFSESDFRWRDTIWNSKLEVVSVTTWVELEGRKESWYLLEEDAIESLKKKRERYSNRASTRYEPVSEAYKPVIHRWLKKREGFRKSGIKAVSLIRRAILPNGKSFIEVLAKGRWIACK